MTPIEERFKVDTEKHEMTVLHDDGLYRHLRFRQPANSFYWFDLITVPGTLVFQGDGTSFTFRRVEDMFTFFRNRQVNPQYWAEKLTSGADVTQFDSDLFATRVKEMFVDAARIDGVPAGTGAALLRDVLDEVSYCDERGAHELLAGFEHKGFHFSDTWDMSFRDYDWWFLWALHGIVWGIGQYDKQQVKVQP